MPDRTLITLPAAPKLQRLVLKLTSHAPAELHPIKFTISGDGREPLQTFVIDAPGEFTAELDLTRLASDSSGSRLWVDCDKTFVPHEVDAANADTRPLAVWLRGVG